MAAALKTQKITIRLTDEEYDYINSKPGHSFAEKLSSVIEKDRIKNDITFENRIESKIDKLLELIPGHAPASQFEIEKMLRENNFIPTKALVNNFMVLNGITGKNTSLREVKELAVVEDSSFHYASEEKRVALGIVAILREQEQERLQSQTQ